MLLFWGIKKAPFAFWDRAGAVNRRIHFKEENTSFHLIPNVLRFTGETRFSFIRKLRSNGICLQH